MVKKQKISSGDTSSGASSNVDSHTSNPYLSHHASYSTGLGASYGANVTYDQHTETNPWSGDAFSGKYHDILKKRTKLPVYLFRDKLLKTVRENQVRERGKASGYLG